MPVDRVRAVLKMAQQPISLQSPVGDSDDTNFGDFIEDEKAESPVVSASSDMLKDRIEAEFAGNLKLKGKAAADEIDQFIMGTKRIKHHVSVELVVSPPSSTMT